MRIYSISTEKAAATPAACIYVNITYTQSRACVWIVNFMWWRKCVCDGKSSIGNELLLEVLLLFITLHLQSSHIRLYFIETPTHVWLRNAETKQKPAVTQLVAFHQLRHRYASHLIWATRFSIPHRSHASQWIVNIRKCLISNRATAINIDSLARPQWQSKNLFRSLVVFSFVWKCSESNVGCKRKSEKYKQIWSGKSMKPWLVCCSNWTHCEPTDLECYILVSACNMYILYITQSAKAICNV